MVVAKYAQLFSGFGSYRQRKELFVGFITVIYDTQGLITQTVVYVAEVEVVDTSDCHSEDSGFEPRRSRQTKCISRGSHPAGVMEGSCKMITCVSARPE